MRYVTEALLAIGLVSSSALTTVAEGMREAVLREAILANGFLPANATHIGQPEDLVEIGKLLFESRLLSFDRGTACASCHVDRFGSADGIVNAIGTEGEGLGFERVMKGGDIVPRNTLPFWGRGGVGFDTFFWDGKVDASSGVVLSQFGDRAPSIDPLVVAVHLPPAEIGEMVIDRWETQSLQAEDVETATALYEMLTARIRDDPIMGPNLAAARQVELEDIQFLDVTEAIASFIRFNYRVGQTRLHDFVYNSGELSNEERDGGLLFYGSGGCTTCHSGPYFSDLKYYVVPFVQAGFGRNGFGVDYGRFNVTLREADRYAIRTPPLLNVTRTAPYGHSGSIFDLGDAIRGHVDPLRYVDPESMTENDRNELYQRLRLWAASPLNGIVMSDDDVSGLKAFLGTLTYDSAMQVKIVD
ncbi:His-Xaa-Ser system-associated MauG-like protein [Jannaschia sp. M317]|uniref:His-Xaa-Ser system-associated MauG-like protein n=1 Tax=Jannaschia sp. M317 TaxID=2867011 RepID=UPI0021A477C3|nr:His-Xaa-Ser system-associated MauG-like protein [Jannaschia sp. M317]UWQ19280.1 His-Xaa-Ser system-associated MauG-like protein [Jannaschia sp. M317]